jgi:hypothetical protein
MSVDNPNPKPEHKIYEVTLYVCGHHRVYTIEEHADHEPGKTLVYDDADPFMCISGVEWTKRQLEALVNVWHDGWNKGQRCGRATLKGELLNLLGAEPRKESD